MSILTRPSRRAARAEADGQQHEQRAPPLVREQPVEAPQVPGLDAREERPRADRRRRHAAVSVGMRVWATRSEATIATTIGTATCTMKMDISFFSPNTIGRNTMTSTACRRARRARPRSRPRASRDWVRPGSLAVPEDALRDHDRVVHQHADREQHAHHRQDVEREAEEVHRASVTSSDAGTARLTISVVGKWRRKGSSMKKRQHRADQPGLAQLVQRRRMLSAWLADNQDLDALQLRQPVRCSTAAITPSATSTTLRLRRLVDVDADRRPAVQVPTDR